MIQEIKAEAIMRLAIERSLGVLDSILVYFQPETLKLRSTDTILYGAVIVANAQNKHNFRPVQSKRIKIILSHKEL